MGCRRGIGVKLAHYVRAWPGRLSAALVTAYPAEFFQDELDSGVLDAVHPKFPREIFGELFFERRLALDVEIDGLGPILRESLSRLAQVSQDICKLHWRGVTAGLAVPMGARDAEE